MKTYLKIALCSLLTMFAGCVQSLNPLYTENDVIFDGALLGVWVDRESKETWELTQGGDKQYKLIYTDEKNKKGEFIVHLLKIEGKIFLDLIPAKPRLAQNDFYKELFLTTHSFFLITQTGSAWQLSYLEPEWLKKILTENPTALRHEKLGNEILITASAQDLQKFLRANLHNEAAFSRPVEITRAK